VGSRGVEARRPGGGVEDRIDSAASVEI
jgi:hypothetical protein